MQNVLHIDGAYRLMPSYLSSLSERVESRYRQATANLDFEMYLFWNKVNISNVS